MTKRNDGGLISVALTYVVLSSTVVMVMLSWFLMSQAQAAAAIQRDKAEAALQHTSMRLLASINTEYDPAWLTMTAAQLTAAKGTRWSNTAGIGATATVTDIKSPDPRTITATITGASVADPSVTVTKQVLYRATGVFALGGFSSSDAYRPVWTTRPSQKMLGLFEFASARQVSH
ncbi:hypothetical protein [Curtobacterium sp. MCSS17_016]|uniref:hypothetical protein n=1 Tax=Curtobacterium sp. MCSS17_016 TaxID=2175644 RepID=UPI000DA88841|nr:hypothetical protein [Curtobacterium sp. MCSS17_016]WIE80848.1 hypothetical protein DEJ19_020240 [Curtobacterium sp. MCSS17_016]